MDSKIEAIVIGADHYNTLWLVRSLGMSHFSTMCIIVSDKKYSFVGASKFCKYCCLVDSYKEALNTMMSIKIVNRIPVIASGDEAAAIVDEHYDELSEKYILHDCGGKGGNILHWMDKKRMLHQASESGLLIPFSKTLHLVETDTLDTNTLDNVPFPCIIKPEISALASKKNFRICENAEELTVSIKEIKESCTDVVLQEYIKPQYEYLVYGVRTLNNEIVIPGGLRKIHVCSDINNMGMMSYSCYSEFIPPQLVDFKAIENFLVSIDYHGLFSVEFMITGERAYFLEINMRNDGTAYCTTQAGINIPAIWVASAYGICGKNLSRTYKRKETFCMNEVNYLKYTLCHQSLVKTILEILKTRAFSMIKLDDMKPVMGKILPSIFADRDKHLPPL